MSIQDSMKLGILIILGICWVAMQYCHNDHDFQKRKKKQ
jgi:hypothetical protein